MLLLYFWCFFWDWEEEINEMVVKLSLVEDKVGQYALYCKGYKQIHCFWTNNELKGKGPDWGFNGNLDSPTFTLSHRVSDGNGTICHSFVYPYFTFFDLI